MKVLNGIKRKAQNRDGLINEMKMVKAKTTETSISRHEAKKQLRKRKK